MRDERDIDDEHIGPFNGHNKSEALPNGCAIAVAVAFVFMMGFATYGFIVDGMK